ncbi:MAG TPA: HAMP domain-containing sensor histidine kinase [Acidimicrobiia bacterium]|nr:HAMP domain-containing sensor histidine kinase [Acidimicrobiia bacterium]
MTTTDGPPRGRVRSVTGTLRFRITALATLVVAALLVVAAGALVVTQRNRLTESLEATLGQRARDLADVAGKGDATGTLTGFGGQDTAAQIVSPSGVVLAASANIAREPPMAPPPSRRGAAFRTIDDLRIDNSAFRVLSRRVDTPRGPAVLHVAANLDDVIESTGVLATSLAVVIPAAVLFLAGLMWWLVGRTLRPVEDIRGEVAHIGGTDLHRRVPQPRGDDEIARLARTMNTMLDRVEEATRRQQQLVADASHELRSPLTRMRSRLEVDGAHPGSADLPATQRDILEETVGLQHLVDDLLQLARADAGAPSERWERVDLDDIVLRQARRLRAGGRITVDLSDVSGAQVDGAPNELSRAIRNLVDNAARHAASVVTFTLTEDDDRACLTVADDGPGIPPDEHERVFERFTRLDRARSAADGGTGLGLAITRDIVEHHGGSITVDSEHLRGARFVVTIPTHGTRS